MTDLQANNTTTRSYHAQHLAKSPFNVGQVAHCECRAAAINTVIRQVNLLSITYAQIMPLNGNHCAKSGKLVPGKSMPG